MNRKSNLYIVWNPFQRRAESLSSAFDLGLIYIHYSWEEKNKGFKLLSYFPKIMKTLLVLFSKRPRYVFIQLAPTLLLYTLFFYKLFCRVEVISDCHNTMIYDDHWIKWPLAQYFLRKSYLTLTHNVDVKDKADRLNISSVVLRDPLPEISASLDVSNIAGIDIKNTTYAIIPCGMAPDEPVEELFDAARQMKDVLFVMTWFKEGISENLVRYAPGNILFTGFLPKEEFNALYMNSDLALVLTTREGTQPSGAAEAIAIGVPLVISRIKTTMRLYGDAPVYVDNNAGSIVEGVKAAIADGSLISKRLLELRTGFINDASKQIEAIREQLDRIV